jgi:molecular chaperone DnaK (HSP70)
MNYFKNTKSKTVNAPAGIAPDSNEVKNTNFADAAQITPPSDLPIGPNTRLVQNSIPNALSPSRNQTAELTPEKKSKSNESLNKALLNANINREPASATSDMAPSFMISKTKEGLNEIDIKVAEDEIKKINSFKETLKDLLSAHGQELAVVEQGEKVIIKLNNFEIVVSYNKELKIYEASSKNSSLPSDYLKTITNYFNANLKPMPGKRDALIKTFKISQNLKAP